MFKYYKAKLSKNGQCYLNIACGTITNQQWNNLDFSPYARLRKHQFVAFLLNKAGILSQTRYDTLIGIDKDIISWDVVKYGLPFKDATFDAIYHCHFIEHIDRTAVSLFLNECTRVLKPGGVVRVVFPDLEYSIRRYIAALDSFNSGDDKASARHEEAVHDMLYQLVEDNPEHNKAESGFVKFIERLLRGNAKAMGWSHRWMYDKISMKRLLETNGFASVKFLDAVKSDIPDFGEFQLDVDIKGKPYYSIGAIHAEARKSLNVKHNAK